MARTKSFEKIIRQQMAKDMDLADGVEDEFFNANIAMQVYEARVAAGLTQTELAKRVGTTQSVISRIEDADYDGHSLALLKRIASALGKKLAVEFFDRPAIISEKTVDRFTPDWTMPTGWQPAIREVKPELDTIDAGGLP